MHNPNQVPGAPEKKKVKEIKSPDQLKSLVDIFVATDVMRNDPNMYAWLRENGDRLRAQAPEGSDEQKSIDETLSWLSTADPARIQKAA